MHVDVNTGLPVPHRNSVRVVQRILRPSVVVRDVHVVVVVRVSGRPAACAAVHVRVSDDVPAASDVRRRVGRQRRIKVDLCGHRRGRGHVVLDGADVLAAGRRRLRQRRQRVVLFGRPFLTGRFELAGRQQVQRRPARVHPLWRRVFGGPPSRGSLCPRRFQFGLAIGRYDGPYDDRPDQRRDGRHDVCGRTDGGTGCSGFQYLRTGFWTFHKRFARNRFFFLYQNVGFSNGLACLCVCELFENIQHC